MDIQWEENCEVIGLEVKVFEDSRNNSSHFWQLFGQLLHGKKLINSQNYITGFLFRTQDREWINEKMKDWYFENDVIKFSKIVNLDRIYFYDDIKEEYVELSMKKWLEEIY